MCPLGIFHYGTVHIWNFLELRTEKAMAPHSSTLAWKIPWVDEPGRWQSMGSLKIGHHWATSLSLFTFLHWRRKWVCSCLENPRDGGAWWAAVYGVAQSWTRLKWLSSSIRTKNLSKEKNKSLGIEWVAIISNPFSYLWLMVILDWYLE